jgi:hypothetical protein
MQQTLLLATYRVQLSAHVKGIAGPTDFGSGSQAEFCKDSCNGDCDGISPLRSGSMPWPGAVIALTMRVVASSARRESVLEIFSTARGKV